MTSILDERANLEKFNNKLFKFREKNENLTKLKTSFYSKMMKYHDDTSINLNQRIEKTKTYYLALLRTINLSYSTYSSMIQIINQHINSLIVDYGESFENNELKQIEDNMIKYLRTIKNTLNLILNDKQYNLRVLTEKIKVEKQLIETLGSKPETFFDELNLEIKFEELMELEKNIEIKVNDRILELVKFSENFLGKNNEKLNEDIKLYQRILIKMNEEYEIMKEKSTIPFNYFLKKGELLEKHASIFAAVVVGLSGVSLIASLAGLTAAVSIFSSAFGIVATGGEALQALPFVKKKIIPKLDQGILKIIQADADAIENQNKLNRIT